MDFQNIFGAKFVKNNPSSLSDVEGLESLIGNSIPEDYKNFLLWSDGGEGEVGDFYLSIWTLRQVIDLNSLYSINKRMGAKFVGVGTDGGDYCFALDIRNKYDFVVVPLGALVDEEVKRLGGNFCDVIIKIKNGIISVNNL